MTKGKMTIERLAQMIQRGFLDMATKRDLQALREDFEKRFEIVVDDLGLIRQDIHDIKIILGPLVRTVAAMELSIRDLAKRVERLEEKSGSRR